jgi:hypothetical protein
MRHQLRHFQRAVRFVATNQRSGCCFHRAAAFVLDVPGAELCVGIVRAATLAEQARIPNASRVPFVHAWAELRGSVFALTLFESHGLRPIPASLYYEENGVSGVRRLARRDVLRLSGEYGISAALRHGGALRGDAKLGTVILDAAGLPYRVTPDGVPLPVDAGPAA